MPLTGKTAIVTGAARGLGRAIARRLAIEGAGVAINYLHSAAEADTLAVDIAKAGGKAISVQADIGSNSEVQAMVERAERELGPIDILVNNAGILNRGDLGDFDYSQMDPMRRTNVDGLLNTTRAVIDGMKQRRFGRIINMTSIAAFGTSMTGTTFYAATKAAVSLLTRRFAMELGPHGITVNAIAPGFIETDMVMSGRTSQEVDATREAISAKTMVRRVGRPEDVAHVVAFLASEESSFITAQILTVDGGRMDYIAHS